MNIRNTYTLHTWIIYTQECFDEVPKLSSAVTRLPPRLVLLDLPDKPSAALRRAYQLQPDVTHVLTINGVETGRYRLAIVLFYASDYHYIVDAYDEGEELWLRYDGMCCGGVGQPTTPPAGSVTHRSHPSSGSRLYFPVTILYKSV